MNTLALWSGPISVWGFADWAVTIVIVIAIVALVILFCRVAEVPIPPWVWHALGIVLAAVFFIILIRFLSTL